MGKEFSNHNSIRMAIIAGSILGIIGVGVITIHILLGTVTLVFAAAASGLFYLYGKDKTVICHEDGFTVKISSRARGTSLHEYRWEEVTETKFYTNDSEEDHLATRRIRVKTSGGQAFNLYAMKGFDGLISILNQKTSHLPYKWEKPREFSYIYNKQERSVS